MLQLQREGAIQMDTPWEDLLRSTPMRLLVDMAYRCSTESEREEARANPGQEHLRRRLNLQVVYLASQLHVLRPALLLPPLSLLATVVSSDVANAKDLTGITSALGLSSSYHTTLPERRRAEQRAFESRVLWLVTILLGGHRVTLGFDNVNKLRRFVNGGCLDLIGAAFFVQHPPPPRSIRLSREPPKPASLTEDIFALTAPMLAARDTFQLGLLAKVVDALPHDAEVDIPIGNFATRAAALVRRGRGALKRRGDELNLTSAFAASSPLARRRGDGSILKQESPVRVPVRARHAYSPKFGGSLEESGMEVQEGEQLLLLARVEALCHVRRTDDSCEEGLIPAWVVDADRVPASAGSDELLYEEAPPVPSRMELCTSVLKQHTSDGASPMHLGKKPRCGEASASAAGADSPLRLEGAGKPCRPRLAAPHPHAHPSRAAD